MEINYQNIEVELDGSVATLWLSRPEVHNALNAEMIREISGFFLWAEDKLEIQAVVVMGRGKSFCAGADLQWMKDAIDLDQDENLKESEELSSMFKSVFESSKIVVAAIHGNVYGGGNGLAAACDLAFSTTDARFSLSETKIGMAAASITPYLLNKIRAADLKELIFTSRTFNSDEAVTYGLIKQTFPTQELMDAHVSGLLKQILENGRLALVASKQLINKITMQGSPEIMAQIPGMLAKIRVSAEAQEGFAAFLEKRTPKW